MSDKGSLWQIWDLHVHSPATVTYGGNDYDTFITNLGKCKAAVIGINDYCTVKGYEEVVRKGGVPGKVIFPVVEMRMNNLLQGKKNPNGVRINFHIIFDNDPAVLPKISTWMQSLKCFDEKGSAIQLGVAPDLMKASFDFDYVIESLKEYSLYEKHALIWLPYDEYGGIDEIDPNPETDGFFKISLISKAHIMGSSTGKQIDFFKWKHDRFTPEDFAKWSDKPKPCIKGSDAHEPNYPFGHLRNHNSDPTDKFCWINAETTFNGLKQILIEPDRVFIGEEPDLIKRVRENKTKFIKSLSVKKVEGVSVDDIWFDNFEVTLNSGLVAIIGKKGNGKSAITDIVSLCSNTHQEPSNFSFLEPKKFRKQKPYNLSERFEATLTWHDGTTATKRLNQNPDPNFPERVKYIPQNFLERLCANIESDAFELELKQIIYSHTPNDKRLGKSSLDELINYKSGLINDEIVVLQAQVGTLNKDIELLEVKATAGYKTGVENELKLKKDELTAHLTIEPKAPSAGQESEASKQLVEKLTEVRKHIKSLEDETEALQAAKTELTAKREELTRALQYYNNLDEQLKLIRADNYEHAQVLVSHNLKVSDVFTYNIDTTKISALVTAIDEKHKQIDEQLDPEIPTSKAAKLRALNLQLKIDQEVLDTPAREQQKYLDELRIWTAKKKDIEGSAEIEGSLRFFETQLLYLNEKLGEEISQKYTARKKLAKDLYSKKIALVEIRKELFQPVTKFIEEFKELKERYDVKIDVALELRSFSETFVTYINQVRIGTFQGKEEGYRRLQEIIERSHFDTAEGFEQFIDEILDNLRHDKRYAENNPIEIPAQLRGGAEVHQLYDYIFNAEYLQPVYNLKLGNKTLEELSPGERGALLLIFYLILDKDDIPLIIDQPEENLDNESVYYILVHFIKKVKEKRQIVIVTHNPNLAIVCDAEQIINMQIEKENKNRVKYISGAIENEEINKAIVNILEGTLPAFNNRDAKYIR